MNKNILKTIAIVITVLLAGFAAVMMFQYSKKFQAERESLAEIANPVNDKLVRLMVKKGELEQKLSEMDEKAEVTGDNMGSIIFLIAEPKKEVLTDIVPILDDAGFVGVIAISTRYYPGVEGCMTWDDIKPLLERGWELCINSDNVNDIDMIEEIFKKGDMELPKTVYYPQNKCTAASEQIWLSDGFNTVIEYEGITDDIEENTLWHMAAYGSYLKDSQVVTKTYYTQSKPLALTVGFNNSREAFSKENFESMIKAIGRYVKEGDVAVTNVAGARARYKVHMQNHSSQYSQSEKEEIKKQIEELEKEIEELRNFER